MPYETLGILGGVGPLASVYFADLLVCGTDADCDQAHIPFYLYNDACIPDRSAYLLGRSPESPLPALVDGVKKLASMGSDLIVVTCNTAHYFYDEMASAVDVPVLNIIETAVDAAEKKAPRLKKFGILATDGTVKGEVYDRVADRRGLQCVAPSEETQEAVMKLIYDVKVGKDVDPAVILRAAQELEDAGCEAVILGCTELSVVARRYRLPDEDPALVDAMTALAAACVALCGKKWKEPDERCVVN